MNLHSILVTVHVLIALGLIGLVMLQQGRGADAGAAFGSGSAGSVFGSRGPASFLTRSTAILATLFFVTSLTLGYLAAHRGETRSVLETVDSPPGMILPDQGEVPLLPPVETDMPTLPAQN
jgi:preprotein translocase subunit SecG